MTDPTEISSNGANDHVVIELSAIDDLETAAPRQLFPSNHRPQSLWDFWRRKTPVNLSFILTPVDAFSTVLWLSPLANIPMVVANVCMALGLNYYYWLTNRDSARDIQALQTKFDQQWASQHALTKGYTPPEPISAYVIRQSKFSQLGQHVLPGIIYIAASMMRLMTIFDQSDSKNASDATFRILATMLGFISIAMLIIPQVAIARQSREAKAEIKANLCALETELAQDYNATKRESALLKEHNQALEKALHMALEKTEPEQRYELNCFFQQLNVTIIQGSAQASPPAENVNSPAESPQAFM